MAIGRTSRTQRSVALMFAVAFLGCCIWWCCVYFSEREKRIRCISNLTVISLAKGLYAQQKGLADGDMVTLGDLRSFIPEQHLECPCGGEYCVNRIGEDPTCSYTNAVRMKDGTLRYHELVPRSVRHTDSGPSELLGDWGQPSRISGPSRFADARALRACVQRPPSERARKRYLGGVPPPLA